MVSVAHTVDKLLGLGGSIRTLVVSFLVANEGISILENCAALGVPIPQKLIDILAQIKE